MGAMIEIENLQKRFGAITAVDGVSFTVERGTVLGFLGPNGAGKSTTMKMLTGFLPPTGGTARIGGHDITTDGLAAKKLVGYLPEGAPLYPDMTPEAFLYFIAEIRGLSGAKAKARVAEVAEKVSLQKVMRQPIETLSKGFKRRVGLAQAILHDPQVLVLDEPTDGLDPNQKHVVRNMIKEMAREKAIVLSTHVLEEVDALCTRVIIISSGTLVIDCAPGDLAAKSRWHNAVRQRESMDASAGFANLLKRETLASETSGTSLLVTTRDRRPILAEISQRAQKDQWKLDGLHVEHGRLDEVFHELTRVGTKV